MAGTTAAVNAGHRQGVQFLPADKLLAMLTSSVRCSESNTPRACNTTQQLSGVPSLDQIAAAEQGKQRCTPPKSFPRVYLKALQAHLALFRSLWS
jgi:hypothetical protein